MKILKQSFYRFCAALFLCLMNSSYAVELNSASAQQLMALKGIGEKSAQAILQERQRAGPFVSLEDFSIRVKGIGKKRLENLVNQGLHIQSANLPNFTMNKVGKSANGVGEVASSPVNRSRAKKLKGNMEIAEPKLIKPLKPRLPLKP